jgi:glycosyltransferase involved in cell wall biosynthesis
LPPNTLHRAFQILPEKGKGLLQRINEHGARLRERHSGDRPTAGDEQLDPAIIRRRQRIEQAVERVDLVLSPSHFLAESLQADGLSFPKLHVEPTGVPVGSAHEAGRQSHDGLHLLFLGTWVAHKGPQVLARALATMPSRLFEGGQVRATAVGPAPFPAFQKEVIELAQGRLQVRPTLLPHEVPAILSEVDLLVVPSLWAENAPLVVLEALAGGTPVVASRIGGLPELLAGGGGELFEAGDHHELARILTELATAAGRLQELSSTVRAPRDLSNFSAAIEQHYQEVCTRQPVRATGS